ncbi:MAG: DNA mismatch repair endonuclease MutL [Candidatus Thorarchaeota archaeon]
MGRIRVLSEDLASLISAGEVIENPSSVVKELIENSLDAEATEIEVEIVRGGIDRILVSDNGAGILKEDCPICLLRYSTSKIEKKEDIDNIRTYGFRGEALASVAAVADLRIVTQARGQNMGTVLVSRIGEGVWMNHATRPEGTRVEVANLFKHVPARRKHLGTSKREAQRITDVVLRHAAVRCDVGFRLIRDGVTQIDCPPGQTPLDRIVLLWGGQVAKKLVEIAYSKGGLSLKGFILRPPVSRGNRSRQYFSVLRRPIQSQRLSQAVESAYSTLLMKGQFPICAIDITVATAEVDANVHPTKREVRILDLETVAMAVTDIVRRALQSEPDEKLMQIGDFTEVTVSDHQVPTIAQRDIAQDVETAVKEAFIEETDLAYLSAGVDEEDMEALKGLFKIVGQIHDLYILLETEDGLVIVDQHAAHERILYEKLREGFIEGTLPIQELLQPIVLTLDLGDSEKVLERSDKLEQLGLAVEGFGGNEVLISSVPEVFGHRAKEEELRNLVDRMGEIGDIEAIEQFMDEALKITACHAAYRAGQKLSRKDIRNLLTELFETRSRDQCCHGRPSMLKIPRENIDKAFGRLGIEALKRYRGRHGHSPS